LGKKTRSLTPNLALAVTELENFKFSLIKFIFQKIFEDGFWIFSLLLIKAQPERQETWKNCKQAKICKNICFSRKIPGL
jgi:hypothetical protein